MKWSRISENQGTSWTTRLEVDKKVTPVAFEQILSARSMSPADFARQRPGKTSFFQDVVVRWRGFHVL